MQVINAPTRSECDKAHARGDWLDIGITSLRNISRVTWPRRMLWLLLGFSSVPIHLLYNSAAFKTIDTNAYSVVVATPLFLRSDTPPPPPVNKTAFGVNDGGFYWSQRDQDTSESIRQSYLTRTLGFANLTTAECISAYGVDFVTGYSDVIVVVDAYNPNNLSAALVESSTPKLQLYSMESYAWYVSPIRRRLAEARTCVAKEA